MDPAPSLAAAVPADATAYLVTVTPDGRPHTAPTSAVVRDGVVVARGPGRRTRENVAAGGVVSVLWSPAHPAGYALIVDGAGEADGDVLVVRPTRAVLHRPAAGAPHEDPGGGCTADCVEVAL
ncbi:pyridoxamine 5'-phosphate oxidase family protein [Actinomycetospora rhizophila]|uniref:Pyridoxamine 5'-phosphate oxidase family protein n=1 Tax=Actinomycetospora rhizophila TaxID=1416876 RepID=A0ABV9ZFU4_9PSEU